MAHAVQRYPTMFKQSHTNDDTAPETNRSRVRAPSRAPNPKRPRARQMNWRGTPTKASLAKLERIVSLMRAMGQGLTVREVGLRLGMSRQLALYHVKKAVASGHIQMILEPCDINGGLQYRVWDPLQLARHCARWLPMAERVSAALASAAAA
jgi:DNA-binding CsgD family transcriptional regulator